MRMRFFSGLPTLLETHPESPPATMRSSFGGANCGVEEWQEKFKTLDFYLIYVIT